MTRALSRGQLARPGLTVEQAAQLMNVSVRVVKRARVVIEQGVPELQERDAKASPSTASHSIVLDGPDARDKARELIGVLPKGSRVVFVEPGAGAVIRRTVRHGSVR